MCRSVRLRIVGGYVFYPSILNCSKFDVFDVFHMWNDVVLFFRKHPGCRASTAPPRSAAQPRPRPPLAAARHTPGHCAPSRPPPTVAATGEVYLAAACLVRARAAPCTGNRSTTSSPWELGCPDHVGTRPSPRQQPRWRLCATLRFSPELMTISSLSFPLSLSLRRRSL
jgi:hypothetical protein